MLHENKPVYHCECSEVVQSQCSKECSKQNRVHDKGHVGSGCHPTGILIQSLALSILQVGL